MLVISKEKVEHLEECLVEWEFLSMIFNRDIIINEEEENLILQFIFILNIKMLRVICPDPKQIRFNAVDFYHGKLIIEGSTKHTFLVYNTHAKQELLKYIIKDFNKFNVNSEYSIYFDGHYGSIKFENGDWIVKFYNKGKRWRDNLYPEDAKLLFSIVGKINIAEELIDLCHINEKKFPLIIQFCNYYTVDEKNNYIKKLKLPKDIIELIKNYYFKNYYNII
jgi:hypothetical protein